jgi:hypothetical protein
MPKWRPVESEGCPRFEPQGPWHPKRIRARRMSEVMRAFWRKAKRWMHAKRLARVASTAQRRECRRLRWKGRSSHG